MKRRTTRADETPEFLEFWSIWKPRMRHTDGRGDARTAFLAHVASGADPQEIIDGATGFFRFMKEADQPYVPLVASWLNKEAYPDWAERERAFRQRQAEAAENVVQMPQTKPALPANHFSRRWERGEFDKQFKQG